MASKASTSGPLFVTEKGDEVHGLLAEFAGPAEIYRAAEVVRDAGYSKWDCYAPFPVHGLDEAMGVKRTLLPLLVGGGAIGGVFLAFLMQNWISKVFLPLVTQGKPYGSLLTGGWESFVPITFELGVLFSAFTALFGMLAMNQLPRHNHPLMKKESFLRVSDNAFMIAIEAKDKRFDPVRTRELLVQAGAMKIEIVEE